MIIWFIHTVNELIGFKNLAIATQKKSDSIEKELTKEEREEQKRKERLLQQYAYDLDEIVENSDGEAEIVYTGGKEAPKGN